MKIKYFFFLFIVVFIKHSAKAQHFKNSNWINLLEDKSVRFQGQGWSEDVKNRFDRLPASHENIVRKEVWNLSENSAGIYLDFYTRADSIVLQYKYQGKESLKNMSSIGVSGLDIYAQMKNNQWVWVKGRYTSFIKDSMSMLFDGLKPDEIIKYRLYLPLYNTISDFKIGLSKNAPLEQKNNLLKPVIVYGTSIAQGASASRAGMAWTSILGRRIKQPVINLGFSGNGRLEKEIIDLISEKEASIYIIDCLPNLVVFSEAELREKLVYALRTLRKKHPKTPIIFTEHACATINLLNNTSQQDYQRLNSNFQKFINDYVKGKDNNVFVLKAEEINLGIDSTVDGVHPSDLGMLQYADAYEKLIKKFISR